MKKFIQSKGLIAIILAITCAAIIIVCLLAGRNKNSKFIPDNTQVIDSTATGSTNGSSVAETTPSPTESTNAAAYLPAPTSSKQVEEYPKVMSETNNEVMIEFTPTEKTAETTPPAPAGRTIIKVPDPEHPVNINPEVTAPATEAPTTEAPTSPQPETGSGSSNGAIYDPLFGWVEPGTVIQSTIDSDGDPNKMVGNMGE